MQRHYFWSTRIIKQGQCLITRFKWHLITDSTGRSPGKSIKFYNCDQPSINRQRIINMAWVEKRDIGESEMNNLKRYQQPHVTKLTVLGPTCISLPVNGHAKHIPGCQRWACRICALLVVLHYARLRPASWPLDQQIEIWEHHYLPWHLPNQNRHHCHTGMHYVVGAAVRVCGITQ